MRLMRVADVFLNEKEKYPNLIVRENNNQYISVNLERQTIERILPAKDSEWIDGLIRISKLVYRPNKHSTIKLLIKPDTKTIVIGRIRDSTDDQFSGVTVATSNQNLYTMVGSYHDTYIMKVWEECGPDFTIDFSKGVFHL